MSVIRQQKWFQFVLHGLFALALVLFFANFGNTGTFAGAWQQMMKLIINTLHGQHLRANYWGLTGLQLYVSIRLIVVATVFSCIIAILLVLIRIRIKTRGVVRAFELVTSALEVIPEAVYVIITVVLLLLLLQIGINLPSFPALDPTWKFTWIPAITLALPGSFYLQRILFLQLRDEQLGDYVRTALSKGASKRRAFYRHVLPNLWPTLIRHMPVSAGVVLSSSLFAEFFLEYTGALFLFTNFAVGWAWGTGVPLAGSSKPTGIPEYQPGLVFLIGGLLVLLWLFFRIISRTALRFYPNGDEFTVTVNAPQHKFHRGALIAGIVLLGALVVCAIFPHLITNQSYAIPNKRLMLFGIDSASGPSAAHPFGTDDFGRDLLALALHSTFSTLWPAIVATILIVAASLLLAVVAYTDRIGFFGQIVQIVGESLSGIPALFILFLALYVTHLNSHHQVLQYLLWIVLVESGRGAYAFMQAIQGWSQFGFLEGAESIGRSRLGILFTHLRSWLGYFSLEFGFSEFARVLSVMAQLAAFHLYITERIWYMPYTFPLKGVVATHDTWMSMIGDLTNNMLYLWQPYSLYAPILFLIITVTGASLIAKGVRG